MKERGTTINRIIDNRKGAILIIALITVFIVAGMAGAFLVMSNADASAATDSAEHLQRLYLAESAVAVALAELRSSQDYDGNGIGNVTETFVDGGTFDVTRLDDSSTQKTLIAMGTDINDRSRAVEVVVETAVTPLDSQSQAAVTSYAPVSVNGNIEIDGRDHDPDGNLVGAGVDGVLCAGTVTPGGNGEIAGNGIGLIRGASESDGVFDENFDFSTMYPDGYPDTPDKVFGVADGTLKAAAQAAGTYFDNQGDYDAFIAANGGAMPGGEILYLDFDECTPMEMGSGLNDPPSIVIMHNEHGDSNAKNIHGDLRGMLVCDSITHINANTTIIGAVQTIYELAVGNVLGNGNADVLFSSEVLANLPNVSQGSGGWSVASWREIGVSNGTPIVSSP